jgi:DNA-binding NtrC family response regulator
MTPLCKKNGRFFAILQSLPLPWGQSMTRSILVIDDALLAASTLCHPGFGRAGYTLDRAQCGRDGLSRLKDRFYDAVLIDTSLRDVNGLEILRYAIAQRRCQVAIMVSSQGAIADAVQAIRAGATDFLTCPIAAEDILKSLSGALHEPERPTLRFDSGVNDEAFQAWRDDFAAAMIGEHPLLLNALQAVRRIAQADCDVLITGASGTGKELIARSIHLASRRRPKSFVALNCAAIPKELIESEIFGHAKGAFTGATERRAGKFETANGGSLFLDEVGEMELNLQSKLLRVLQEREVTPVGDSRVVKLDVRVIAATNQELEQLCKDKAFREDLYYRLNVVPVQLPTLAERRSDIPLLVSHFIKQANRRHGRSIRGIDASAATALCNYTWPGNIRELHNVIERIAVLKHDDATITTHDLPASLCKRSNALAPVLGGAIMVSEDGLDINQTMASLETRLTFEALEIAGGCKARAAELLGLKRTTLVERLKKLNLPDYAQ